MTISRIAVPGSVRISALLFCAGVFGGRWGVIYFYFGAGKATV